MHIIAPKSSFLPSYSRQITGCLKRIPPRRCLGNKQVVVIGKESFELTLQQGGKELVLGKLAQKKLAAEFHSFFQHQPSSRFRGSSEILVDFNEKQKVVRLQKKTQGTLEVFGFNAQTPVRKAPGKVFGKQPCSPGERLEKVLKQILPQSRVRPSPAPVALPNLEAPAAGRKRWGPPVSPAILFSGQSPVADAPRRVRKHWGPPMRPAPSRETSSDAATSSPALTCEDFLFSDENFECGFWMLQIAKCETENFQGEGAFSKVLKKCGAFTDDEITAIELALSNGIPPASDSRVIRRILKKAWANVDARRKEIGLIDSEYNNRREKYVDLLKRHSDLPREALLHPRSTLASR